jgi:hypothetical protein
MATTKTTTPKNRKSAAAVKAPDVDCYTSLLTEIASLECVLDTLVTHDLSDSEQGHLGSAELVLRETIRRLHELTSGVETLQDAATVREVASA